MSNTWIEFDLALARKSVRPSFDTCISRGNAPASIVPTSAAAPCGIFAASSTVRVSEPAAANRFEFPAMTSVRPSFTTATGTGAVPVGAEPMRAFAGSDTSFAVSNSRTALLLRAVTNRVAASGVIAARTGLHPAGTRATTEDGGSTSAFSTSITSSAPSGLTMAGSLDPSFVQAAGHCQAGGAPSLVLKSHLPSRETEERWEQAPPECFQ
jgi:hypothetical protein